MRGRAEHGLFQKPVPAFRITLSERAIKPVLRYLVVTGLQAQPRHRGCGRLRASPLVTGPACSNVSSGRSRAARTRARAAAPPARATCVPHSRTGRVAVPTCKKPRRPQNRTFSRFHARTHWATEMRASALAALWKKRLRPGCVVDKCVDKPERTSGPVTCLPANSRPR